MKSSLTSLLIKTKSPNGIGILVLVQVIPYGEVSENTCFFTAL